jgi:hypothetical protein
MKRVVSTAETGINKTIRSKDFIMKKMQGTNRFS